MFIGIFMIWVYRITHIPSLKVEERWVWMLLFLSELWFGFFWVLTQSACWNQVYRSTFKDRLSHRYNDKLPGVDIFVCTADPTIEPPMMVINTVLSVMAYNYPTEKLSVYLSDDGGSDLTFYALLEAANFSKHWLPFSKKFNIEPRSPAAYFSTESDLFVDVEAFSAITKLYEEMEHRIETTAKLGRIPEAIRTKHKEFSEWNSVTSKHDHQTILQVLIDGRNPNAVDIDGSALPTLVYLSREKRPNHHHNFKAGAMNALIRVSSKISNGKIILNVDCDMYSNNSESVRDALCFFMDEQKGHEIAFVQYPQSFDNITKYDIYGSSLTKICMDLSGMDGYGGPMYVGTGCFHRREALCGRSNSKNYKFEYKESVVNQVQESASELERTGKILADCAFEEGTQWGKEMGLKYGFSVEDVITGLSIHCRGWKSICFNPTRKGFLGIAPITLGQTLVQHKRWSEGNLQIILSKYGPLSYGCHSITLSPQGHLIISKDYKSMVFTIRIRDHNRDVIQLR
ncbi:Cellulose synthase-like protein [Thalictrum thalictroides]|uniref:Cellulose synthase-like protein n=1 Tax=Thalictrum thalictroides TaxID=46969 RepID=A0A7J6WHI5_THATH|nr:Cellulose synthase-like protein [Thalictrum thalictroides]